MNTVNNVNSLSVTKIRISSEHDEPTIFTDIFREDVNIVIWQRCLSVSMQKIIQQILQSNVAIQVSMIVTQQNASLQISNSLPKDQVHSELVENIVELVDMFCYLFDLNKIGLRLTALDHAMCPRFHVDRVPCRLVTTYHGVGTEWLPHQVVNRDHLYSVDKSMSDAQSGLFKNISDICQLKMGEVALLKGESWQGNENAGLVHRSPQVSVGEKRLLLTLDFID